MLRLSLAFCLVGLGCSAATPHERPVVTIESSYCPIVISPARFAYGKASVESDSFELFDLVAKTINEPPGSITLVEIAGHASEGEPDAVAQARADATLEALVARGVPRERLRARGYGAYCPVDTANDEAARATNRRVELKIVATRDGPTGVELGCENAAAHGITAHAPAESLGAR